MSNYGHIPGPWRARKQSIVAMDHGREFVIARANSAKVIREGNEANARLLAEAPELLKLIERLAIYGQAAEGAEGAWDKALREMGQVFARVEGREEA